jgi:hypothetical protein
MAEKQTLKSWTSKQVHKPTDKISNFDKLKAPYILNEYETWGDLYDAVGIEPPKEEPKAKAKDSVKDIDFKIKQAKIRIAKNKDELFRYDPGTTDYIETTNAIKKDQAELETLQTRFDKVKAVETSKKEVKTYEKDISTWQEDYDVAKKDLQVAKDTNTNVAAAKKELDRLTKEKPKAPVTVTPAPTKNPAQAASAAALGLPTSSLTRPATAVEKIAKEASDAKGQVTPKVPGAPKAPTAPALTDEEQRQQALEVAGEDFELPETIFKNVPSLTKILDRYVKENWTESKLRKAIREDVWFRKNSAVIKQRYVQLYNYQDLVDTGQIDPQVPGNTQFEQDIAKLERQVADKARAMGSGIASDPDQIKTVARKMYLTNQGIDDPMTTDFIAAAIRPVTSTIGGVATQTYSGQALKDYQEIQSVARANGLRIKDIIPGGMNERQVLEGIATGRIDANRIAQDTRILAQQGQPKYVRDLLSQGYNLDQVFAPYRQTMANLLEINADEIDLNDSTLRSAISDKGDMNIYDFKKTLKKDNRWQYTENAKQEVSDATLKILRDFGLQG